MSRLDLKTWRLGFASAIVSTLLIAGCQTVEPVPARMVDSIESIQAALMESRAPYEPVIEPRDPASLIPDVVAQALVPDLGMFSQERTHRFDLSVQAMPATEFFMSLVHSTGNNMVVHPEVSGSISLDLKQVTMEEVMDIVRDAYDFEYRRTGNMYHVLPRGLRTEIFQLNYLAIQRTGSSETSISAGSGTNSGNNGNNNNNSNNGRGGGSGSGGGGGGSASISTATDADFWAELQTTLEMLIGNAAGSKVITAPQTGLVVVKAMPSEIRSVQKYLDRSQLIIKRQVILEAKILEVSLSDSFQAGINWAALIDLGGNKSGYLEQGNISPNAGKFQNNQPNIVGVPGIAASDAGGGIFSATVELPDFTAVVDLLETQGTVQVLSSPRVSTVNNQKAVIKVGEDEFFVTEVSSTTTTGTSTTTTPSVELTPFFSGIALDVTPQISDEGEIILHVHPQISQVRSASKTVSVGGDEFVLPLAVSSIRESDSIVKAQSGQVVVIGGLMQNSSDDINASVPGAGDIPLFGHLFKQKQQASKKSELVILLRPTLTGGDTWHTSLTDSLQRFEDMHGVLRP